MNEHLKNINFVLLHCVHDDELRQQGFNAAERMAEEIERLREIAARLMGSEYPPSEDGKPFPETTLLREEIRCSHCGAFVVVRMGTIRDEEKLKAEITRLKAELAGRPEVVFCKDCRSMQHEYSQDEDGRIIAELLVCAMSGRPIGESDFCSHGQRKESEVGK